MTTQAYREGQDAYYLGNPINPYQKQLNALPANIIDIDSVKYLNLKIKADQWYTGYVHQTKIHID